MAKRTEQRPRRRTRTSDRRARYFASANTTRLRQILTDAGLDTWARKNGLAIPSSLRGKKSLAARVFYGEVAPGLDSIGLTASLAEYPELKGLVRELFDDVIEDLSKEPLVTLQRERLFRQQLPAQIQELGDQAPGPLRQEDDSCVELKIEKKTIIDLRATDRNHQLLKGLLAIFGLDMIVDLIFEDAEDKSTWSSILDALIIGDWALAAVKLAKIIWKLLTSKALRDRFIKRFGRWGLARFLFGLTGKLVPAILAALLALNWYLIWKQWQEKAAIWDARLKELYDASKCPNKDEIFMGNLGYIPK
jgi:hypothetical protein